MMSVPGSCGVPRSMNGNDPDSAGSASVAGNASKEIPSVTKICKK